jgi:hypothetical protein
MITLTRSDGPEVLFTEDELACKQTGVVQLADGFGERLVELRETFGHPIHVTNCCRSQASNKSMGGHPRSLHCYIHNAHGLNGAAAIDIAPPSPELRWRFVGLAKELGWSLGIAAGFWHLDRRDLAGLVPTVFGYSC